MQTVVPKPDDQADREARSVIGPDAVDRCIRQAVGLCWGLLPRHRRNTREVKKEIQRIVERVLQNLDEDKEAFELD